MLVLYCSSGIDLRVIAVDKHIDAARRDINMHFLLLRIRSEELSRAEVDESILDRPLRSSMRVDRYRLDGLLEGRSVVVGSNHVRIIKGFPSPRGRELRYNKGSKRAVAGIK